MELFLVHVDSDKKSLGFFFCAPLPHVECYKLVSHIHPCLLSIYPQLQWINCPKCSIQIYACEHSAQYILYVDYIVIVSYSLTILIINLLPLKGSPCQRLKHSWNFSNISRSFLGFFSCLKNSALTSPSIIFYWGPIAISTFESCPALGFCPLQQATTSSVTQSVCNKTALIHNLILEDSTKLAYFTETKMGLAGGVPLLERSHLGNGFLVLHKQGGRRGSCYHPGVITGFQWLCSTDNGMWGALAEVGLKKTTGSVAMNCPSFWLTASLPECWIPLLGWQQKIKAAGSWGFQFAI